MSLPHVAVITAFGPNIKPTVEAVMSCNFLRSLKVIGPIFMRDIVLGHNRFVTKECSELQPHCKGPKVIGIFVSPLFHTLSTPPTPYPSLEAPKHNSVLD